MPKTKPAALLFCACLTLLFGRAFAAETFTGIKGAETGELTFNGNLACYAYQKYTVINRSSGDSVGSDILVKSKGRKAAKCDWNERGAALSLKNSGADYFSGLYSNFLFVDSGTGPSGRRLTVYDLEKSTSAYSTEYAGEAALEKDALRFWLPSGAPKTGDNCPRREEWEKQGLTPSLEEDVRLDLKTLKLLRSGWLRCTPRQ